MATEGELIDNLVNLGGFTKKVYELLKVNPTSSYIIEKTGRSKNQVSNTLRKLIKKGLIERVDRGIYKIKAVNKVNNLPSQNERGVTRVNQLSRQDIDEADYLRLHNLDIQLRINFTTHRQLYNLILNRKIFKNIRSSGANHGFYFDVPGSNITYMITNNNVFAKFPEKWELVGNDIPELMSKLYDVIKSEINVLQTRYNFICFKDGRVNFNIRNMHIALVKNGIAKEFYKKNINNLVIYDDNDKKPRYIMDLSHGNFELEAIHPNKAFDDADEAQYFMTKLKDGEVRSTLDNDKEFFDEQPSEGKATLSGIRNTLTNITSAIDQMSKENKETATGLKHLNEVLQSQANVLNQLLKSQQPTGGGEEQAEEGPKNKPFYIG